MIEIQLVRAIAAQSVSGRFLQIEALSTDEMVEWLKKRDIHFFSWKAIHFLWSIGVIRPVALTKRAIEETPDLLARDRFHPIYSDDPTSMWFDTGFVPEAIPDMD